MIFTNLTTKTVEATSLLIYVTVTVPLAYLVWTIIYNLFFSPLSRFPGPKLAACTNLPYLYWTSTGEYHYKIKTLHDKYGDVVRTGPKTLVYRTPQAWKDIYGHRKSGAGSFLKDPQFYLRGPRGPNIINADDEYHSRARRLLSHAFSEKALRDQEGLIQSYVDMLVERLDGEFLASRTADMSQWYNFALFDIIGDLSFGEPFGCLRESQYHPWVKMVFVSIKLLSLARPLVVYPFLAPIARMFLPQRLERMREEHFALTTEKVHQRLETKTERPDFMTYILRFDDERSMTTREMEANAAVLILAGSETTASVLSGFTFYVLTSPNAYRKLLQEIRGAFKSYDEINFQSVSQLAYLNAAIEETLRVFPPVPGATPRVVPKGGALIDGEFIPEDVSVSGAHYSTYHAEEHFTEADSFIPERWLEDKDECYKSDKLGAVQPFSLGPRNCLGRNLAYAELRLIVSKVFWTFDMAIDRSAVDWNIQKAYNVWERKPLMVKMSRAQH